MRILQQYRFRIGTKIPFDKWPGIIENFLHEQHLHHRSFHYYLDTYDNYAHAKAVSDGTKCRTCLSSGSYCEACRKEAADFLRKGTACERAVKENPFLGNIETLKTQYSTIQFLHNFSEESNRVKEDIYAILSKIYRRYGFAETTLIYRDIDFFGRRVPTITPKLETLIDGYLYGGFKGSSITLFRSALSADNAIILTVESCNPGETPDATPYADALAAHLPGIKRTLTTEWMMDDNDRAYYDALHRQSASLVAQAEEFFMHRVPASYGNKAPFTKVSTAAWLKKMARRYGYTYRGCENFIYYLNKKLLNGHYVCATFCSTPSEPRADPVISLSGLGFEHTIWFADFIPQNAAHISEYLTQLFDCIAEAEQTVFPALLDLYPPTPDGFIPMR